MHHTPLAGLVLLVLVLSPFLPQPAQAQTPTPLWAEATPGSKGSSPKDIPTITPYLPEKTTTPASAVIICPGGGYGFLSSEFEGTNVAAWFQSQGVAAFVLKYRLPKDGYRHPIPLQDAQRALRLVRSQAGAWNIDPARIGIMGFSAGGHLASTLATHFDAGNPAASDPVEQQSCRPDFAVLIYPVITLKDPYTHQGSKNNLLGPNPDPTLVDSLSNELQVTAQTPPTLLVHASNDKGVPIENSRMMLQALRQAGVTAALQEYPNGGHGFGFGHKPDPGPKDWLPHVGEWLKTQNFMP